MTIVWCLSGPSGRYNDGHGGGSTVEWSCRSHCCDGVTVPEVNHCLSGSDWVHFSGNGGQDVFILANIWTAEVEGVLFFILFTQCQVRLPFVKVAEDFIIQ